MIFTPRLSTSPCVNVLTPSSVRTMMVEPERTTTVPFFTSVTVTGVTVVRVVMVAVPFMPGFQLAHGQRLSVDDEAKVIGNGQLPRAFRQPDDQRVAVHREHFEALGFRRRRRLLRQRRDRPSHRRSPLPGPPDSLHVS